MVVTIVFCQDKLLRLTENSGILKGNISLIMNHNIDCGYIHVKFHMDNPIKFIMISSWIRGLNRRMPILYRDG